MKWISIATVLLVLVSVESTAQITIKTEYFGTSAYRDEHNQKVGSSKGSAMVYHGSANLPLSMKRTKVISLRYGGSGFRAIMRL